MMILFLKEIEVDEKKSMGVLGRNRLNTYSDVSFLLLGLQVLGGKGAAEKGLMHLCFWN